jgi:CRISPR system Cascade subunit CasE
LSVAELSGVLQVTDPEALMRTLTHGLGHGRSFGLGLLLLKPVR